MLGLSSNEEGIWKYSKRIFRKSQSHSRDFVITAFPACVSNCEMNVYLSSCDEFPILIKLSSEDEINIDDWETWIESIQSLSHSEISFRPHEQLWTYTFTDVSCLRTIYCTTCSFLLCHIQRIQEGNVFSCVCSTGMGGRGCPYPAMHWADHIQWSLEGGPPTDPGPLDAADLTAQILTVWIRLLLKCCGFVVKKIKHHPKEEQGDNFHLIIISKTYNNCGILHQ